MASPCYPDESNMLEIIVLELTNWLTLSLILIQDQHAIGGVISAYKTHGITKNIFMCDPCTDIGHFSCKKCTFEFCGARVFQGLQIGYFCNAIPYFALISWHCGSSKSDNNNGLYDIPGCIAHIVNLIPGGANLGHAGLLPHRILTKRIHLQDQWMHLSVDISIIGYRD